MKLQRVMMTLLVVNFASVAMAQSRRLPQGGAKPNPTAATGAYKEPAATMHGVLKRISGKEMLIAGEGDQTVSIRLTHKTKFLRNGQPVKASEIAPGSVLSVDVGKDPDLNPQAVNVMVDGPPVDQDTGKGQEKAAPTPN